jgi:hypothetical protein
MNEQPERTALGDPFDRVRRNLNGLPDVVMAGPATVETFTPVLELAETWIVTTARQRDRGDVIFLQVISGNGGQRFIVPPKVADAISRQRDALSVKNRRKGARQAYETQVAAGNDPAARLARARKKRR